jgi:transmembrane sensor
VVLADGSILRLNTASKVDVHLTSAQRVIRLVSGEALFDVAHDPNRPFFVDVGHARIRAVGTEFNVRMRPDLVELTVTEGVVAVASAGDKRPLGQQPHISAGGAAAIRQGTVAPADLNPEALRQRTAWREGVIELDGNTVEQAVAEFNRYRDVPMVIGDQRIATLRVGGRFGLSESDRFVAALQRTLPVHAITGTDGIVMLVQAD